MEKTLTPQKKRKYDHKKVLVLVRNQHQHDRDLLLGISKYAQTHKHWLLFGPHNFYSYFSNIKNCKEVSSYVKKWEIDGVVICEPDNVNLLMDTGVPIIMFPYTNKKYPEIPALQTDAKAAGKMAAQYYLERGFKHLAFCGFDRLEWSIERCNSFVQEIETAGLTVNVYKQKVKKTAMDWIEEQPLLTNWISDLPKPVGLFACNDNRARQVIVACQIAQIEIPNGVAVLGVDNDETICHFSDPPISSIRIDIRKAGYEIAKLLDQLMNGEKMNGQRIFDTVVNIVSRESTDIIAIQDETIRSAISFIIGNASFAIQVRDVAEAAGVSQGVLAKKFRLKLGYSVNTLIKNKRIELIKNMIEAGVPITEIAISTSFSDLQHISRFFRQETGITPTEYKKSLGI